MPSLLAIFSGGLPNGMRKLRLETKTPDTLQHMLPLVFMSRKYTALRTVRGRAPLCLRCKKTGHFCGECEAVLLTRGDTYAAALAVGEMQMERTQVAIAPALSIGRSGVATLTSTSKTTTSNPGDGR